MPKRFRTYFWPYMALTAHIRSILLCPFLGAEFLMVTVSQPILNLQLVQLSVIPENPLSILVPVLFISVSSSSYTVT